MALYPGQVRIVCTDRSTHPSRELVVICHNGDDPELLAALLADDDLSEAEARQVYLWDRTGYVSARARSGSGPDTPFPLSTVQSKAAKEYMVDPDDERRFYAPDSGALWRLRCPTCGRDVQLRDDKMRQMVEGLLAVRQGLVDISLLPANLA